jgi:hypothetical protein
MRLSTGNHQVQNKVAVGRRSSHARIRLVAASAIAVTLAAGLMTGSLAQAAPASATSSDSETAPFEGRFVATEDITPDPTCGGLHILARGTGWASELGARTTALFDECANFAIEPGRVHVYGNVVLRAPNGDELHLSLNKAGNLPDPTGNIHLTGTYTITGGTGRFDGATGAGTTTTDTNVNSTTSTATLDGTLTRPDQD